jgi:DNA-binding transcriptional LysR family regulator
VGRISDRWLRTALAVARAGNFTAAARDLGVGQPAVSHSVARLEQELGVRLFERHSRHQTLTNEGERLMGEVEAAFSRIDRAVEAARSPRSRVVNLSVSTSLANFWLLPRLPDFKRHHPSVELRVITTDSDDQVGRDDADLWIPLGLGPYTGLESTVFRPERLLPVAAPELARRLPGFVAHPRVPDLDTAISGTVPPAVLATAPLLHLEERYRSRYDWWKWFAHHGVDVPGSLPGYRSNDYSLVLQAALEGQGVALGWVHIVTRLLEDGRLVALGEAVDTGQPFPILHRAGVELRPDAENLLAWLVQTH